MIVTNLRSLEGPQHQCPGAVGIVHAACLENIIRHVNEVHGRMHHCINAWYVCVLPQPKFWRQQILTVRLKPFREKALDKALPIPFAAPVTIADGAIDLVSSR